MTTDTDAVALDALEESGVVGLSMWNLRCLAAYLRTARLFGHPRVTEYATPAAWSEQRYRGDLQAYSIDSLHGVAQWDDADWVARRSGARALRMAANPEPEMFQDSLT